MSTSRERVGGQIAAVGMLAAIIALFVGGGWAGWALMAVFAVCLAVGAYLVKTMSPVPPLPPGSKRPRRM